MGLLNKYNNILYIAILLLAILYIRECIRPPQYITETVTETITEVVIDSVPYIVEVDKPVVLERIVTRVDSIIDTVFIIEEFFTKNIYDRVLKNDTSAFIGLVDTVFNNRLLGGTLTFINRRPTIINTTINKTTITPQTSGLFIGGYTGKIQDNFTGGVGVFLKTRQDYLFGVTYGLENTIQLHGYFKL